MPKIDSVSWGKVKIDGKNYHQVLIIGDEVIERDKSKLETLFGTTHHIGDWEQELLLSGNPEMILVANGWSGVLKVSEKFKVSCRAGSRFAGKSEKLGIELREVLTPKVVGEYNRLIAAGKRINALIHTTC